MKAEQYINVGYQRLVSYECKGGGFEWFGNDPGNQVLTAYGLLEFADMTKVYEVDPKLIERTQKWLVGKQGADGSWTPDKGGIAEGAINRQTDEFRTSAYILWALGESGAESGAVTKGLNYLTGSRSKVDDPYALALAANAYLSTKDGQKEGLEVCDRLVEMRQKDDRGSFWATWTLTLACACISARAPSSILAVICLAKEGWRLALTC